MENKNLLTLKYGELDNPHESRDAVKLEVAGTHYTLPGPFTARRGPQSSFFIQFHGAAMKHRGVGFRGTVQIGEDATLTGNLAEGLHLDPAAPDGPALRAGTEVMVSVKGILQSKDTYLIEGDCNAKKCALSRDLQRDPL